MTKTFAARRWLVTGGCGFIGSSLIAKILAEKPGTTIRVLDNFSVGTKDDLLEVVFSDGKDQKEKITRLEIIQGDIRDYDTCLKSCTGIDVVVHLAANTGVTLSLEKPRYDMDSNVTGTFNMLEASRQNNVAYFIFASSVAAIGETEPPVHEGKVPRPISPYGASKLAGEAYCNAYYNSFGIKTVSLRFSNVYGPFSKLKDSVVAKFFRQALSGETLVIYGDGNQTRDFIYIDDLVNAIFLSLKTDAGGEVFQIATCRETTVNEIAGKIKYLLEYETGIKVKLVRHKIRLGEIVRNYSDISKARRILGFKPVFDIDTGLKRTFEYFRLKYK